MRLFKFLFALVFVAAVLGVAAIAGGWLWLQSEVAKPGPSLEEAVFEVEPGEHLGSVAQRLEEQGLISDERTLRLHARLEGQQTAIKVGEYAVPPRASVALTVGQMGLPPPLWGHLGQPSSRSPSSARITSSADRA